MRIKIGLILNLDHETRKTRKRTHVQNKNPTRLYCKEEMKTEQGYDKKMYCKLTLNRLKVMEILLP
jgi:hypothetical protein